MADKKYVVGIGASAGGLDALKLLLQNLQKSGQHSYVIAQHMATDTHMQLMLRLIAQESALPVSIAGNDEMLLVDQVYLIPAGYNGSVMGRRLYLRALSGETYATPSVNVLFNSIARECGDCGVGIVLSGVGTDGAAGCQAIKSSGGVTIAQAPETAQYNGMPMAAIDAEAVVYVQQPETIGALLVTLLLGKPPSHTLHPKISLHVGPKQLTTLLQLMQRITGLDFFRYKEETLVRRIRSRVAYLKLKSVADYIRYCIMHPDEMLSLRQMFLVTMSYFFRDKACFVALRHALAEVIEKKPADQPIHVLVPACASGEECYSIAIVLAEILKQRSIFRTITITGVDLNHASVLKAMQGVYHQGALKEMEPQMIDQYFIKEGASYRIVKEIQDMCSFTQSNVFEISGPVKYDLISCRNLLIYFKVELQQQLMKKFYQDLQSDGLLFLGQAENIGVYGGQYFTPVDYSAKLYRRRPG